MPEYKVCGTAYRNGGTFEFEFILEAANEEDAEEAAKTILSMSNPVKVDSVDEW